MKLVKIVRKAFIFWSVTGVVLFAACTDITDVIGEGLVPESSKFNLKIDTLTVESYSILRDSVVTSGSEEQLLGAINDPVFGKTKASIYAKYIYAGGFDTALHEAEFFDSVTLHLVYTGRYYGDTMAEQVIKVYELTENLPDTISYYSNQTATYNPVEVVSFNYKPEPKPNISLNFDPERDITGTPPQINIMISKSKDHPFVQKLLDIWEDNYIEWDEELELYRILDEKFYEDFNGFYITSEPVNSGAKGALIGTYLFSSYSYLKVYAHDTVHGFVGQGDDLRDTIFNNVYEGKLNFSPTNGLVFNHYDHENYVDADVNFVNQVINGDQTLGEKKLYVQSLAGVHTRIKFPHIENLRDLGYRIAVNKAELILHATTDLETEAFDEPPQLGIQVQYEGDSINFVPDFVFGTNFLGGKLDTTDKSLGDYKYKFRVTRFIQEILDEENEGQQGLYIFASPEHNLYNRVTLFGSNPENNFWDKAARLEITYTIIDK